MSCNKGALRINSDRQITRVDCLHQMVRGFAALFFKKFFINNNSKREDYIDLFSLKMKVQVKRSRLPLWKRLKRNLLLSKATRITSESRMRVSHTEVSQQAYISQLNSRFTVLLDSALYQIMEYNVFCVYSGEEATARTPPVQKDIETLAKGETQNGTHGKKISTVNTRV